VNAARAPVVALALGLVTLGAANPARGEAAPDHSRSDAYYGAHAATGAGLFAASIAVTLFPPSLPGPDPAWFPGDLSLRGKDVPAASRLSDALLAVAIAAPLIAALSKRTTPRLPNTAVVYGETLGANLLLNALSKFAFSRPRPYTYGADARNALADWYVSFYSGHASTAFAAAVSGSYLFAESAPNRASSVILSGLELTLASATAVLRTRAGKHYYSDTVVGALIGTGLGIAIPLAHGARYRPEPSELAAAGGGLVLGTTLAAILPFSDERPGPGGQAFHFQLAPTALGQGGVGLSAVGSF
jgi:membrane-associated phospholipid phosphatase